MFNFSPILASDKCNIHSMNLKYIFNNGGEYDRYKDHRKIFLLPSKMLRVGVVRKSLLGVRKLEQIESGNKKSGF